jgi:hypothetical protein
VGESVKNKPFNLSRKNALPCRELYRWRLGLALLFLPAGLFGVGEKTLVIGGKNGWDAVERRAGVTELSRVRPYPVLVLSTARGPGEQAEEPDPLVDLSLSFDEGSPGAFRDQSGRYGLSVSPELRAAARPWSRAGPGAAQFTGPSASGGGEAPLRVTPLAGALLGPGSRIRDFSIEFWAYPLNMETGEQVLTWTSSRADGEGGYYFQRIRCVASKNRFQWSFLDFFSDPAGRTRKTLSLTGSTVLPRAWSPHLVRFDADLGLLEYLVDGRLEALDYATSTGAEGGEVYTPVIGENGSLVLGGRYAGLLDEFRVLGAWLDRPDLAGYAGAGRAETRALDLGERSRILRVEAAGGRTTAAAPRLINRYAGTGDLHFTDHSALHFFIQGSDNPFRWDDAPWIPFTPGEDLPASLRNRYIRIAADFYPAGDGETSPYLDELRVLYLAEEPPDPPIRLSARALDGAVELSWQENRDQNLGGYLIYYGEAGGEYFGRHAIIDGGEAASPVDVGRRNSVRLEGLENGRLYYFAVAAYRKTGGPSELPRPGECSREEAARPLRGLGGRGVSGGL